MTSFKSNISSIALCIDLEATCFEGCSLTEMECIEIGIIALDESGKEISRFQTYVKPQYTELTDYCTHITNITDDMLTNAPALDKVLIGMQK